MNVGVAHSEENPNSSWLSCRGGWISYSLAVFLLHTVLWSVPFLSYADVWTCTNTFHNIFMYLMLHLLKGAPWETNDQGLSRRLTHWEQIDSGKQFTDTRKFLTIVPVVLFILASYFTNYNTTHFVINVVSFVLVLLPKLPQFHKVRIFDINKY